MVPEADDLEDAAKEHRQAMPEREVDVLRQAVAVVADRLPPGWSLTTREETPPGGGRVDWLARLRADDGYEAVLIVEAKRSVTRRDLPAIVEQLRRLIDLSGMEASPLVVARYLAPPARNWLADQKVSYADATGNVRLVLDRPALFLRDTGADKDPWRGPGRPRATLQGPPAARVVRALVDFRTPVSVPELVKRSSASTGATYRVVEFLEQEALIERAERGPITTVRWRELLQRWSEDYGFQRSNPTGRYLHPRGLPAVMHALAEVRDLQYVITGSLAAQRLAPYAPAKLAMIYVDDPHRLVERVRLREVDAGANILLAWGKYDVVFDRAVQHDGVMYTAPSQTAVDLLTGPGRNPAEAEALLDWMEAHEHAWRR